MIFTLHNILTLGVCTSRANGQHNLIALSIKNVYV